MTGMTVLSRALVVLVGLAVIAAIFFLPNALVYQPSIDLGQLPRVPLDQANIVSERVKLESERLQLVNNIRTMVVQLVSSLAVLLGLWFNADALRKTQQQTYEQLKQTRDQQIRDRFAKAYELMGSNTPEARVGAVYLLYALSLESQHHRDEVLTYLVQYQKVRFPDHKPPTEDDRIEKQAIMNVVNKIRDLT